MTADADAVAGCKLEYCGLYSWIQIDQSSIAQQYVGSPMMVLAILGRTSSLYMSYGANCYDSQFDSLLHPVL